MTSRVIFVKGLVKLAVVGAIFCFHSENLWGKAAKELIEKLPFDVCVFFGEYQPRSAAYVFQTRDCFLKSKKILFNSVVEVNSLDEARSGDLAVMISQPSSWVVKADVYSVVKKEIIFTTTSRGPTAGNKIAKAVYKEFAKGKPLYQRTFAEKMARPKEVFKPNELIAENNQTKTNSEVNNPIVIGNNVLVNTVKSDVDENIPTVQAANPLRFALIIGNEDYSSFQQDLNSEVNVAFASNDARIFKEYAKSVLGVPDENIIYIINAKTVEMNRAISKINLYAKNTLGKAELIFYYAGHGLPDEETKEPYLIPVDVSSSDLRFAVKLKDLYGKLTEYPTQRVTVFIDACFSGGARNQGLVAARGVKVKPKDEVLSGKLIVFTASSGEQSSSAFKDKQHGMFTYYLLKKLQDSNGTLTYRELSDYLTAQVGLKSVMINNKEQNPQVNVSPDIRSLWEQWGVNK
jgi:hypothetical protein